MRLLVLFVFTGVLCVFLSVLFYVVAICVCVHAVCMYMLHTCVSVHMHIESTRLPLLPVESAGMGL